MKTKIYREITSTLVAIANCRKAGNNGWLERHEKTLDDIARNYLPRGSGIDRGTTIDREASNENKLVLTFSFHHMDEHGFYCGWTDHKCIVTPSLLRGIDIRITGRDRNHVKEYLYNVFDYALSAEYET